MYTTILTVTPEETLAMHVHDPSLTLSSQSERVISLSKLSSQEWKEFRHHLPLSIILKAPVYVNVCE